MEFASRVIENLHFRRPILQENYMKLEHEDEFLSDALASEGHLQDVHRNNQFHVDGLSIKSEVRASPPYFNQFDTFDHGYSSNFSFSDPIPLVENSAMGNFDFQAYMNFLSTTTPSPPYFNQFETLDHGYSLNFNISDPTPLVENSAMGNFDFQPYMNFPCTITPPRFMSGVIIGHEMNTSLHFQEPELSKFAFPLEQISAKNRFCRKMVMVEKNLQIQKTRKAAEKVVLIKGQWTPEEDRLLNHLVEEYGSRNWSRIAKKLKGRIGKQCRERWQNHLRPNITKAKWTAKEDKIIIETHAKLGNKWAEMARRMKGRTENSIKNHWNSTRRKLILRRRSRKFPETTSLLEDYIDGLIGTSDVPDAESDAWTEANMQASNGVV